MSDYNVDSTLNWLDSMEAANEAACYETAIRNGLTHEQADSCDLGIFNCVGCPWDNDRLKVAYSNQNKGADR